MNFCEHCGRAYELITTALQRGKSRQLHCSIKCSREAAITETCQACGKPIMPSKHVLCPKCNTKRWQREESRDYPRDRYRNNLNYRLRVLIRGRVKTALRSQSSRPKKSRRLGDLEACLGCTIDELKAHIKSQFTNGMTWENWAKHGWHLDHIRPLVSFDLTDESKLKEAMH